MFSVFLLLPSFCINAHSNPRVCYGHLCPGCSMLSKGCNASLGFCFVARADKDNALQGGATPLLVASQSGHL